MNSNVPLRTLKPGERFRLPLTRRSGIVRLVNPSSVTVDYDPKAVEVTVVKLVDGQEVEETVTRNKSEHVAIAPETMVEVL